MSIPVAVRLADPGPGAAERSLVCFPFGGGAAESYRMWLDLAPPGVATWGVNLPGRTRRPGEHATTDPEEALTDLLAQVEPIADGDTVLFGHSMGALLAFEVARRLRARGTALRGLVLSAGPPPSTGFRPTGPTGPALPEPADPELAALVLPSLRADLELCATWTRRRGPRSGPALDVPTLVLGAVDDPVVPPDDVEGWAGWLTPWRGVRWFDGGHFYLAHHAAEVEDALAEVGAW